MLEVKKTKDNNQEGLSSIELSSIKPNADILQDSANNLDNEEQKEEYELEHSIDIKNPELDNKVNNSPVLGSHVFMPVDLDSPISSPRRGGESSNNRTAISLAVSSALEEQIESERKLSNIQTVIRLGASCALLWGFLVNLSLVGIGFKLLGGKDSAGMFSKVKNPFSAMMSGILATVLVQSSSTSTSIIIAIVGAGMMSSDIAIPMIMGANIGTTVTNTLLSLAYFKNTDQYKRGFAGACVHDLFNFLTVAVLLPLQWATKFLSVMTWEMAKHQQPYEGDRETWKGVKPITSPITNKIAIYDKKVAKAFSLNKCDIKDGINPCEKPLLKSGILKDWGLSDNNAGGVCLAVSIPILCLCLILLVKLLKGILQGTARRRFQKAIDYNPYLSMLIGCGMTILFQSSSVTTSVLTPLCAMGAITLEQMLPLTLGANVGTTVTGLLSAFVATSNPAEALQVALAHLFFNIMGVMIWYPHEKLRNIPLKGAEKLGEMAEKNRTMPFLYVGTAFFALPAACYGITSAIDG